MPTIACINATSRTLTYLISQSLSSPSPPQIRAIVRSEKRFLSKLHETLPSSDGKTPSNLSVHEYNNYSDPSPLIPILKGVDTIYVALGINDNKPTTLNQDVLQAITSALAASKPADAERSPTKIVFLCAHPVTPYNLKLLATGQMGAMERFFHTTILSNQYLDIGRAQAFLEKQSLWIDWTVISPGLIVDDMSVEETNETESTFKLAIQDPETGGEEPHAPMSYARLARAMLVAAQDGSLVGKNVSPVATGRKVQLGWQAMQVQREVMGNFLSSQVLPATVRLGLYGLVCAWLGYYISSGKTGFGFW